MKRLDRNAEFIVGLLVLCACIALGGSLHIRYLFDESGGQVFSRQGEIYLFLARGHVGREFTYLEIPFLAIGESVIPFARGRVSEVRSAQEVARVTPAGVEKSFQDYGFAREAQGPKQITPFEDGFYANCQAAVCKWTPNGFVTPTPEEQASHTMAQLTAGGMDGKIVNGWAVRDLGVLKAEEEFEIRVGAAAMLYVANRAKPADRYPWIAAELHLPDGALEPLYNVNGQPRRVSRKEYERQIRRPRG
jgi:hypothetical protein